MNPSIANAPLAGKSGVPACFLSVHFNGKGGTEIGLTLGQTSGRSTLKLNHVGRLEQKP
jgi:hypothetical protein